MSTIGKKDGTGGVGVFRFLSESGPRLRPARPNEASHAKVVVLKNTGHWLMEENPGETTDALMKFLEGESLRR